MKMIHAIRSIRGQSPALFSTPLKPSYIDRKTFSVRFVQTTAYPKQTEKSDNMDKKAQNQAQKTGDVMSNSFGEGYSTRSDEEGFGGIYGSNQSLSKPEEKDVSHPEYDKSQGSEVKEKEKGRHHTNGSS